MAKQTVAEIFAKLRARLEPTLAELPAIIGEAGVNFSLDAFEKEAWDGVPWKERQDKKNTRALLVRSGRLKRSIRVVRTTANSVTWGSDVPYAMIHNNGGVIERAARSETFVRPRYDRGKKGKMFGGLGAFRKMTAAEKAAEPTKGQEYKAYSINMPRRTFLADTPALRAHLKQVARDELKKAAKGL